MTKETKNAISITLGEKKSTTTEPTDELSFLKDRGYKFTNITLPWTHPVKRLALILRDVPKIIKSDIIVTNEYLNAAMVSAILFLSRSHAKHAVIGLNFSGNRKLKTKSKSLNNILNVIFFKRIDIAIVASKPEADIFHLEHDIPRDRFAFIRWSYDLPQISGRFNRPDRPYFCLIGRNNRDHETFCSALNGLDADGIIIAHTAPDLQLPPNIQVYTEIPLAECIDCIRHATANVVLVKDANRGAGHITIVTAMHCGRPQIISNVDTALDYFIPNEHALTVPLADSIPVRDAMLSILQNRQQAERMGRAAEIYASQWLSHAHRKNELADRLRIWLDTGNIIWDKIDEPSHITKP